MPTPISNPFLVERLNAPLAVENTYLQEEFGSDRGFEGIIGTSRAIGEVLRFSEPANDWGQA